MFACAWLLLEDIERHHNGHAEQVCDLDLLLEVAAATACNEAQILERGRIETELIQMQQSKLSTVTDLET